jgi:hypothetical protein
MNPDEIVSALRDRSIDERGETPIALRTAQRIALREAAILSRRDAGEGRVNRAIFDAALSLVEDGDSHPDPDELERYLRAAIEADERLGAPVVESLLVAAEKGRPQAWIRISVLRSLVEVPRKYSRKGGVPSSIDAFRARENRIVALVEARLDDKDDPIHDLFEHRVMARRIGRNEPRDLHRLYERYILARPPRCLAELYQPGRDDDVAAIDPLVECVGRGSRTAMRALQEANGNPNNTPGFALCREAFFELARFSDVHVPEISKRLQQSALPDEGILLLASAILEDAGSRAWLDLRASGRAGPLLLPLSDANSSERGQAKLRWLLYKLGILGRSDLPQAELPDIPAALPQSYGEALALQRAKKVTGKGSADSVVCGASLPPPLEKLFDVSPALAMLADIQPSRFDELAEGLEETLERHRRALPAQHVERGLSLERQAVHIGHLSTDRLFAFAMDATGDFFVLSPELVSEQGQWAVFRVSHDQAFTIELEALSVAEFLGRAIVGAWARREMLGEEVQQLLEPPEVPGWLVDVATKPR